MCAMPNLNVKEYHHAFKPEHEKNVPGAKAAMNVVLTTNESNRGRPGESGVLLRGAAVRATEGRRGSVPGSGPALEGASRGDGQEDRAGRSSATSRSSTCGCDYSRTTCSSL